MYVLNHQQLNIVTASQAMGLSTTFSLAGVDSIQTKRA
jgi:hypothetical protein